MARFVARVTSSYPLTPFPQPAGSDREYYDFCVRFWTLYAACWDADLAATVKALDQYLRAVPE